MAKRKKRKQLNRILRETYQERQRERQERQSQTWSDGPFKGVPGLYPHFTPTGRKPSEPQTWVPRTFAPYRDKGGTLHELVPDDVVVLTGDKVLLVGSKVNKGKLIAMCKHLGIELPPEVPGDHDDIPDSLKP